MKKRTWWIPPQKQYWAGAKEWFCGFCEKLTPIERNPEWDGQFKGAEPAPEWFVRCAQCKNKHWQTSGYECPNCGWDRSVDVEPIEVGPVREAGGPPWEIPSGACRWTETFLCPLCGCVFTYENANY